jgi:uncharacterized protein (DUF305 family)
VRAIRPRSISFVRRIAPLSAIAALLSALACAGLRPSGDPAAADDRSSQRLPNAMVEDHAHHPMGDLPPVTIPDGALFTEADVRFMQGMIAHHAQAVHMTGLAEGAGASARVHKLAQKIDLSQAGEIALMQEWLHYNKQFVPDTSSWRTMQMPGMLTGAELAELAAARGEAFDRLFLTLMIRHHEGALLMVADLLAAPRAAQDVDVGVLASDIETTQTAEIGLMWQMLAEMHDPD